MDSKRQKKSWELFIYFAWHEVSASIEIDPSIFPPSLGTFHSLSLAF